MKIRVGCKVVSGVCLREISEICLFLCCRSISYFSTLLDKDDRAVRIAAGEALALIFEVGSLEKFSVEDKGSSDSSTDEANKSKDILHIQGLRAKVLNQVRSLSVEAGGKGSAKKDLNSQRNTFRDILEFLEVVPRIQVFALLWY